MTVSERIYAIEMDTLKEFVVILITAAVAALFMRMIVISVKSAVARKKEPVKSVPAKVIAKSCDTGVSAISQNGVRSGKQVFTAEFEADETLTFYVSKSEYDSLNEGDTGFLSYRGRTFLGFTKDALYGNGEL